MIEKKEKIVDYQNLGESFVNISQVSDEGIGDWSSLNMVTIHRLNDRKIKILQISLFHSACAQHMMPSQSG